MRIRVRNDHQEVPLLGRGQADLRDDLMGSVEHGRRWVATVTEIVLRRGHDQMAVHSQGANCHLAGSRQLGISGRPEQRELRLCGPQKSLTCLAHPWMPSGSYDTEARTRIEARRPVREDNEAVPRAVGHDRVHEHAPYRHACATRQTEVFRPELQRHCSEPGALTSCLGQRIPVPPSEHEPTITRPREYEPPRLGVRPDRPNTQSRVSPAPRETKAPPRSPTLCVTCYHPSRSRHQARPTPDHPGGCTADAGADRGRPGGRALPGHPVPAARYSGWPSEPAAPTRSPSKFVHRARLSPGAVRLTPARFDAATGRCGTKRQGGT